YVGRGGGHEAARPGPTAVVRDGEGAEEKLGEGETEAREELDPRTGGGVVTDYHVLAVPDPGGFALGSELEGTRGDDPGIERDGVIEGRVVDLEVAAVAAAARLPARVPAVGRASGGQVAGANRVQ